ncbi:MAG: hypothetical protein AAGA29_06610 [Planctomycetota bacterium]
MPDFLPRRDSQLRLWASHFARKLSATPEAFGVSAAQAARLAALEQAFAQRYTAAQNPSTRTAPAIRAKDDARDAMVAEVRELAGQVRSRRATTNDQLAALGLRPRKAVAATGGEKQRRHAPAPEDAPRLRVENITARRIGVRLYDSATGRLRKPGGAAMAVVLVAWGDRPPRNADGFRYWCATGKPRLVFEAPPSAEPGAKLWFIAAWLNERGEQGPWSVPAMGRVNFGGGPVAGDAVRVAA